MHVSPSTHPLTLFTVPFRGRGQHRGLIADSCQDADLVARSEWSGSHFNSSPVTFCMRRAAPRACIVPPPDLPSRGQGGVRERSLTSHRAGGRRKLARSKKALEKRNLWLFPGFRFFFHLDFRDLSALCRALYYRQCGSVYMTCAVIGMYGCAC